MSLPFGTSLRRDPNDPRGLIERIDAVVLERLEEAVDFVCLDLMVQLRRRHGRTLPEEQSERDRHEFKALVREFLSYLRKAYWSEILEADRQKISQAEARAGKEELERLVAIQVSLAKQRPDYWQRLEALSGEFIQQRLAAPPPKAGFLDRLLGR